MLKTVKAGDGDGFFVEHLSYVLGQAVERGGVAGERCLDCGQPAGQLVYAILIGETLDGLIKMFFGEFHGKRINGEGSIANGANPSRTRPCSCFSAARPRQAASGRRGRCGSSPGLCPGWLSEFARWPRLRRIRPSSGAFGFFSGGPLLQLAFHVGDHALGGVKRTVERTFFGFVKLGVYDSALLWGVLVVSGGQYGNDGDDAPGHLEFQHVADLDAGLLPDCGRQSVRFGFDGEGHRAKNRAVYAVSIARPTVSVNGAPEAPMSSPNRSRRAVCGRATPRWPARRLWGRSEE